MKGKALRKHSPHGKIAASVLLTASIYLLNIISTRSYKNSLKIVVEMN